MRLFAYFFVNLHRINKVILKHVLSLITMNTKVPEHYLLCYNSSCALAEKCLGNEKDPVVTVVNPLLNGGESCKYFRQHRTVRMAYGMQHAFDNVLAKDIAAIRSSFRRHFGNGPYYSRVKGTRPITPQDQKFINEEFSRNGYKDEVVFDRYEDEIEW